MPTDTPPAAANFSAPLTRPALLLGSPPAHAHSPVQTAGNRSKSMGRGAPVVYRSFVLRDLLEDVIAVQSEANVFTPSEQERRGRLITRRADDPQVHAVGAFLEGRLVGFCYGAPFDARWPWAADIEGALRGTVFARLGPPYVILELHVVPRLWRQGIGSALMDGMYSSVSARWVLLTRKRASRQAELFYRARGFTETPLMRGPFVVMAAKLPRDTEACVATVAGDAPNAKAACPTQRDGRA